MRTPDPDLDEQHEAAFIAAIQPDAPNEAIDTFLAIHQQVVEAEEAATTQEEK